MRSKPPQLKKIVYIKLSSLDDLSRYVCNYDYTNSTIASVKHGSGFRIFAIGEEIGKAILVYYVNTTKRESAISYTYPSSSSQKENSHFIEGERPEQGNYMRIINISSANLREAGSTKTRNEVPIVELSGAYDLVSAALLKASGSDSIPYIYSFSSNGKKVICAFDVIEGLSDDNKILYYALLGKNEPGNFARYKYSENKIDFTEYMGEHSYMYAKIINLAEPFPFFKMPD